MSLLPYNPYRKQLLVMSCVTWFLWLAVILAVEPSFVQNVLWRNSYLPFFVLTFLGVLWLWWGISGRWKRSLVWSGVVTAALWLQLYQLASPVNLILLLSFGIVWEYYWHLSKSPKEDQYN